MQKMKLMLIPICIGVILLFFSWNLSYPVSLDSPNDVVFNHFSYLYWISLAILFSSFFIVAIKTENYTLRWAMALATVLLIFSQGYFYYMIPGSDANQFRGLTEYFLSTGDLSSQNYYHAYYQWPIFFILNKVTSSITGLNLRFLEFITYGSICFLITSFVFLHVSRKRTNAFVALIAFFIILIPISIFEFWSAFALSLCLILLLLYLDKLSNNTGLLIATIVVFITLTFAHILVPLFFIIYCLIMYLLNKNSKYFYPFAITSIIYTLVLSFNLRLADYLRQLSDLFFLEMGNRLAIVMRSSIAPQPYVDVIAQTLSRTAIIATAIITGIGFVAILRKRNLKTSDYAMFLTGAIFLVGLVVSPSSYHELTNRSYFLIGIPVSLGASYLCESRFKKYFKTIFLILLVLFTFFLIHQSFSDSEIFYQTKAEQQCSNFFINYVNQTDPISVLSQYRVKQYLMAKSSGNVVSFGDERSLPDIAQYNYVVYAIGLAQSFLAINYSVEDSLQYIEANHFNMIYNSGNFSRIFSK
jgi:hypothetical protein